MKRRQALSVLATGASAVLSQSLEEESTLAAIAQVIVPEVGDLCRIDLLDEHGVLQRKLTHHFDPARTAAIAIGKTPFTARSVPVSESSPTKAASS